MLSHFNPSLLSLTPHLGVVLCSVVIDHEEGGGQATPGYYLSMQTAALPWL